MPALVHPFGIFMLRQFFLSIPKELEDAARIDGSSRLGILWNVIILPVSKAPISALVVFVFMFQWNAFLWPLIVLNSQDNYTLQIGLAMLRGDVGTDYALQMAATAVATLPLVVLFLDRPEAVHPGHHAHRAQVLTAGARRRPGPAPARRWPASNVVQWRTATYRDPTRMPVSNLIRRIPR